MIISPEHIPNLLITNVDKELYQPNSIDLILDEVSVLKTNFFNIIHANKKLNYVNEDDFEKLQLKNNYWYLEPNTSYMLTSKHYIEVPINFCACVIHKSTLLRRGCFITSSLYDSGFKGLIGAFGLVTKPIHIEKEAKFAQMIFFACKGDKVYNGYYNHHFPQKDKA